MSVASPTAPIVADSAPRPRGRTSFEEVEAQTPAGRNLQRLESLAFNGSYAAIQYRGDRERRLTFDARADQHIQAIAIRANDLLLLPDVSHEARALCAEILHHVAGYFEADQQEDAAAASGDVWVARMHAGWKRLAGWVERSAVALRELTRKAVGR